MGDILGLSWGGPHTCGARVELLWVTAELAALQGLPACLHLDLAGATMHAGHIFCDACGEEVCAAAPRGTRERSIHE